MELLAGQITVVFSYLFGAIPFGLITARIAGIGDIRSKGSGNIGATNVWRIAGAKYAMWVFVGDIGKGALAVALAHWTYSSYMNTAISKDLFLSVCGMAAVIGHVFPVYLKFRGGKGVNTTLGVVATLLPLQALISFGVFIVTLAISRYVSLGSIIAAVTLSATLLIQKFVLYQDISITFPMLTILLAVLVVYAHRKNISRILNGTENKFSFTGPKKNE